MYTLFNIVMGVPLLAAMVKAAAQYPAIPSDLTTPTQQRLAVSGLNSISVGWNTYEELSRPCVEYGTSLGNLSYKSCSTTSVTYPTSRTWSNTVILGSLKPATTYYYKIVSTNSTTQKFASPRTPGDTTPFTTAVVIDLGVYGTGGYTVNLERDPTQRQHIPNVDPSQNHTTIGRLQDTYDDYEWVLHPGDFGYADDWYLTPSMASDGTNGYEAILEQFYGQLSVISQGKPYMASPGNHEADCEELGTVTIEMVCPDGQKNFTDFNVRFGQNMPTSFASTSSAAAAQAAASKAAALAKPPFWYSFEYGMVHVTMLDTETDFPDAPDEPYGSSGLDGGPFGYEGQQLAFLEADLASVDRAVTPWLVVAGHRPLYSTGIGNTCGACKTAFEGLLLRYGVDLGVFGHVHNSQRFAPVFNDTLDPRGMDDPTMPMYIVAGGAGNIEGTSSVGVNTTANRFAYDDAFSYATLTFRDANHLDINFINSETGNVLDSSTLYKSHQEQFVIN